MGTPKGVFRPACDISTGEGPFFVPTVSVFVREEELQFSRGRPVKPSPRLMVAPCQYAAAKTDYRLSPGRAILPDRSGFMLRYRLRLLFNSAVAKIPRPLLTGFFKTFTMRPEL